MSDRDEFERLIKERNPCADITVEDGEYIVRGIQCQWWGYQMRQPYIDALRADSTRLSGIIEFWKGRCETRNTEITALKAEVEKLRKDAERSTAVHKTISDLMHDHITAMQSAFIEWQHGRGAEEAMGWIANTLSGPGLLPDENSAYGTEAQAWFDANKSRPFPKCFCGRPSHILSMGQGFCSEEHYKQRDEHHGDAAMKEMR